MKLKRKYSIKYSVKVAIRLITQSRIATFINCYLRLPQNYSFFIFGTHGVGFHSLLYYISLCKTKHNQNIYPMPLHILSKTFDLFGHFTSLRFYKVMHPIIARNKIEKWGMTFDGGMPRDERWIKINLTKKVPAIILVRDPILALTTTINYEIFCNIHSKLSVNYDQIYMYIFKHIKSTCGFKQNMQHMDDKISKYCFIDCSSLIGEKTYPTMKKLANFLDLSVSFHECFMHSINSTIQRYFASPIIYQQQELYLSSFPYFFRIMCYPYYFCPNYCDNLGYTHRQEYISDIFPKETFFLFSKEEILMTPVLQKIIENYLNDYKVIMEEYNRLKIDLPMLLELIQKHDHINYIQTFLKEETSIIPEEILATWKAYSEFSRIVG